MFDTFFGLPVHPLIVHAVVVLLPLAALGVIALVLKPSWRARYDVLVGCLLVAGAVSALIAKPAGSELSERLGVFPETHATLGTILTYIAVALAVIAGGWLVWERQDTTSLLRTVVGALAAILSVAVVVLTVLTGHSGSEAVWSDATAARSATSPEGVNYSMEQVSQHDTSESCWAAIDGNAYDLTDWINSHPGGPERILQLCGTDATYEFTGQHHDASRPNSQLKEFLLGPIA